MGRGIGAAPRNRVVFETAPELLTNDEPFLAEVLLHAHGKRCRGTWAETINRRCDFRAGLRLDVVPNEYCRD